MGVWHRGSGRTSTGARKKRFKSKRKYELGRTPTETVMGEAKQRIVDSHGRHKKKPALRIQEVNVTDTGKNITYRAVIEDVEENKASMDYQRRKVMTRGTIIKTSKGRAKITSRPGQEGILNAVLI